MNLFSGPTWLLSDNYIAAHARQLFRALKAKDSMAIAVIWSDFQDNLVSLLTKYLKETNTWNLGRQWLDCLSGASPTIYQSRFLRVRDEIMSQTSETEAAAGDKILSSMSYNCAEREPFEFYLSLSPALGSFESYTMRFGRAHRLDHEIRKLASNWPQDEGWAFSVCRGTWGRGELIVHSDKRFGWEELPLTDLCLFDLDDPFIAVGHLIAVYARQLFRDVEAKDSEAREVSLAYLRHQIISTLRLHLRDETQWGSNELHTPNHSEQHLSDENVDLCGQNQILVRDTVCWRAHPRLLFSRSEDVRISLAGEIDSDHLWCEPVEFDLTLNNETGALSHYTLRFCSVRPSLFIPKGQCSIVNWPRGNDWVFCFRRELC